MSEPMPEITEADDTPDEEPARAHAEQLLQIFDARNQEQDKELLELLNRAYQERDGEQG